MEDIYTSTDVFINELYSKFYSNSNSWKNKTFLKTSDILLKCKAFWTSKEVKNTILGGLCPNPTGELPVSTPSQLHFPSTLLCLADAVVGYCYPNSILVLWPFQMWRNVQLKTWTHQYGHKNCGKYSFC